MSIKVGINGFGRIGRNLYRSYLKNPSPEIEFVAVNDLTDAATLAHLLKYDSVHGTLSEDVRVEGGSIFVGGDELKVLSERDPAKLPWSDLGVDVVAECTGLFRDREKASKHISAGAKKVFISAPAKGPDVTVVPGITDGLYDSSSHNIISIGSCTTNCVVPVAWVLHENFGIERAFMTTVHGYTSDQRLVDLQHRDLRRARAAAINIIPTTTGAARMVGVVIPELNGKIDGMALRVPVPNVSIVDLVADVQKEVTVEEVHGVFKQAADGKLKGVLQYEDQPLVSTDYIGNPHSSIYDSLSTMVIGKKLVKVLAWYDNEWGFSNRMVDMLKLIAKKW